MRLVPRRTLIILTVLSVGRAVLIIAQAQLLARSIADLETGLLPWLAPVVAGRAAVTWANDQVARRSAATIKQQIRHQLVERAGDGLDSGAFATLMSSGLDALDASLGGYLPQLALAAVVPVLVLAQLFVADPTSGFIVLLTLPLIPVFGALIGLHTRDATRSQWEHRQQLGGHFRDVIAGLTTLRAFDRTDHQAEVINEMAHAHRNATMRALRIAFLSGFVLELLGSLSVALVAVPIGLRLLDGRLPLSTALVVLLLTPEAFGPLRALGARFHAGAEGMAALEQIEQLTGPPAPASGSTAVPTAGAEIRLVDVSVSFPDRDQPALQGVSLTIRPGDKIAIIGPSGAGKSTLLHLLLGFVAPDRGQVLIGDVDLRDLDLDRWRRQLAWLPQSPHLFTASIADNLRLGAPDASDAAVKDAARAACALDFITALPDQFATALTENGAGLSAGQRQRVALARAYLRDAPIVLLDEPTARLDMSSETEVVTAIARLLPGRTAVMVAHRPAVLRAATRIVRVEAGRVSEITHPETIFDPFARVRSTDAAA